MTSVEATSLRVRSNGAPDSDGRVVHITPESAGWRHVGFETFRLRAGQRIQRQAVAVEACVVMLAGRCRAVAQGQEWSEIGGRSSPFDGPPHALYLPVGSVYLLEALTNDVEFAVGTGPVTNPNAHHAPRVITPNEVRVTPR